MRLRSQALILIRTDTLTKPKEPTVNIRTLQRYISVPGLMGGKSIKSKELQYFDPEEGWKKVPEEVEWIDDAK